jgi:hypothetical protein
VLAWAGVDPAGKPAPRARDARADETAARRAAEPAADLGAGHAGRLLQEVDETVAKARQGVTTLRMVVQGWELQHGPHRPFEDGDCAFLASLDFCSDSIESSLDWISQRISEECDEECDVAAEAPPSPA